MFSFEFLPYKTLGNTSAFAFLSTVSKAADRTKLLHLDSIQTIMRNVEFTVISLSPELSVTLVHFETGRGRTLCR